jgi:EAL domain-containing protein (putative c-di-GMP-specific phosphodiesterase class I)/GGDEF domain-containing protein
MDRLSAPVTLLILSSKQEDAEQITTTLRNGGLPVRGVRSDDPSQLEDLIATHDLELVLCCAYDANIDLSTCMAHYRDIEVDVPLVVIADAGTDSSLLIGAMRSGARDLTEQGDRDHLQLVVARELADLRERRSARKLQQRLDECEQRAKQAMDASGEAVAYIQEGVHVQANPAYCALFGFDNEEDLDGYPLLDLVAPAEQAECRRFLRSIDELADGESAAIDIGLVRADSLRFDARMILSKSSLEGEPCIRALLHERQGAPGAATPGLIDADTGLPNRSAVSQELGQRLAQGRAETGRLGVIYIGADIFAKLLHDDSITAGLEAMTAFGAWLRELAPQGSFLGRVCDDGFMLLLDDATESDLIELATRIRTDARIPLADTTLPTRGEAVCGAGLVLADPGKDTPSGVLDAAYRDYLFRAVQPADTALGSAESGSLHTTPDSGYHSEFSEEERDFAAQIDRALAGEGFQLVYQPIVSLKGDSQENYSVFLRLRGDDEHLREAKEFLAIAVQSGHMIDVDRWVINHAIEELARQREQNRKINFFVNIAEETLQEENLLIWICDQLRHCQARGNWLTFQVLEDHARRHPDAYTKLSEGLRKVRCRVALNRVRPSPDPAVVFEKLRSNFVKLAPELAKGLADDDAKQKQVLQLANMAREAGVRTIATGVEEANTLSVLWTAGVDYVQGNFLQRPSPNIESQ